MSQAAISESELLLLAQCPECGYSLHTAPEQGRCSECGVPYDRRKLILFGTARGSHAFVHNSTSRWLWFYIILIAMPLIQVFSPQFWKDPRVVLIVIMNLASLAFVFGKRFTTSKPWLVEVHLDEQGCAQDDDPDQKSIFNRLQKFIAAFLALGGVLYIAMHLEHRRAIGWMLFCFVSLVVIILVRIIQLRGRKRRRKEEDRKERLIWSTWKEVDDVLLDRVSETHYRLRLPHRKTRFGTYKAVDAEIPLTTEQASALEGKIRFWMANAKEG